MLARKPEGSAARLATLDSFEILDSGREKAFDDVVDLAARICDAPVALISFVDRDRQWFKASVGMERDETPLSQSICSHAILVEEDLVEIPDTALDARTADNPLCSGALDRMRFYAGAPLVASNGHKVGTLCVLDDKPRHLTDLQRDTLKVLAGQVMRQLELRRALRNEEVLRKEIDHRVKNSLQTVLSVIRIYGGRLNSEEARDAMSAVERRVQAVAQLHAELTRSTHLDRVELHSYLGRVARLLQDQAPRGVRVETDLDDVTGGSRTAAVMAMVVSEFVANAFKHAFPDGREGQVRVTLGRTGQGLRLSCSDDGVGVTSVVPAANSDIASIGTRLMEAAAEQIGGALDLRGDEAGYRLTLDLPDMTSDDEDLEEPKVRAGGFSAA